MANLRMVTTSQKDAQMICVLRKKEKEFSTYCGILNSSKKRDSEAMIKRIIKNGVKVSITSSLMNEFRRLKRAIKWLNIRAMNAKIRIKTMNRK